ncbi:hypothetical protein [Nitrolancea hollandica]|uniref:Uncharacterized protein n=1 Tax=Nitrolancea hollandica Lb TaxID=1129897 RepID=I4EGW6_9BACT|nr:hypothetical protein [Nitrolancea hollandica]CCF83928.1 hypothetical protein NITHO_2850010 [Nitrolancea hollandica Lb]
MQVSIVIFSQDGVVQDAAVFRSEADAKEHITYEAVKELERLAQTNGDQEAAQLAQRIRAKATAEEAYELALHWFADHEQLVSYLITTELQ